MTIFHIFKSDCRRSSRITLQTNWVQRTCWVHKPETLPTNNREKIESCQQRNLSFFELFKIILFLNSEDRLVFHCQSSLIYLIFAKIIAALILNKSKFIYDIHDLNEWSVIKNFYDYFRYIFFRTAIINILEFIVLRYLNVSVMTVSDGLAETISFKYGCEKPTVVMSAVGNSIYNPNSNKKPDYSRALIFFGTQGRVPDDILGQLRNYEIELHLYGRFESKFLKEIEDSVHLQKTVIFHGEYSPQDMSFLQNYNYLILYSPNNASDNFKYSLPNKFFQAIGNGLSLIISSNFVEIRDKLSSTSGACSVLSRPKDIKKMMENLNKKRTKKFFKELSLLASNFHDTSKTKFLDILD